MGTRRNQFVRLQDAHQLHTRARPLDPDLRVNVFAIIVDFGFPKKSGGTDYCLNIRVVDDTFNKTRISVNIFTETAQKLPHITSAGDVIRLTQVVVKEHHGDLILVFKKSFSSFALYKGKDGDDFAPYQISSRFKPGAEDKKFVANLRKWWLVDFRYQEGPSSFPMLFLRELKVGFFDVACKILHCWEVEKDKWWIFVWDGTDAPPNAISAKLEDENNSSLPLTPVPLPLPRELLCTFPAVGTVLAIKFDPVDVKSQLHVLNVGKWVKFINMEFQVHAGLWHGVFTPRTKLRYTPNEDILIIERQRLYEERISRSLELGTMPFSCSLTYSLYVTEVNHENVLHKTLMDVLTHSEVTAKFKCVVRVVAVKPCQVDNLRSCDERYRLQLTLEDPTARIHAYVIDQDWETLFGGYPGINVVTMKLNRLLGVAEGDGNMRVNDTPRNPPWVSVCIKSFYKDKTDVWGTRKFRIFDTKIVGET